MSWSETVFLGAIAGFTIFLGLPAARLKNLSVRTRAFLSMSSVGILLFLFFDIFAQLNELIEASLEAGHSAQFILLFAILLIGFGAGLLGLMLFEQRVIKSSAVIGKMSLPVRLALAIAAGIGLHNFSEGLAIGHSAGRGDIAFALLLIIGFGLHNATEGFGIVGPMIGTEKPSWKFIGLAGLIGGGPTFVGTLIGFFFVSDVFSVLFLSLAAGALVYVIGELFHLQRSPETRMAGGWGILAGFALAFMTDLLLVFLGA